MDPWGQIARSSREDIRALQNKKLARFIKTYVYPFSPRYRRTFDENGIKPGSIRTVEDLQAIPFTSKLDLIATDGRTEKFKEYILQPDKETIRKFWPATRLIRLALSSALRGQEYVEDQMAREFRPAFMTFTTGTTNLPTAFLYSNHDVDNLHIYGARMLKLFDIPGSVLIVNMFPCAPPLAFWQVVFGGLASSVLIMSTGGGKVMGTDGNISALMKMKPAVLLGVPSYVYHVLRTARDQGRGLFFF